ncbi:MAG TPA: hypothetical protein VLZ56_02085 [Mycoplana sp.]|nr:hypothetical protein [Mycoplana sp.]
MKHILLFAFALGLSAPVAQADCAYHQTSAKAEVVDQTTTASLSKDPQASSEKLVLLQKQQQATEKDNRMAE